MAEFYFPLPTEREVEVYEGGAGRKTVVAMPGVGRAVLFQLPDEFGECELISFELEEPRLVGHGLDAALVEQTLEVAREQSAIVVYVPLYDADSSWFLHGFRVVPPGKFEGGDDENSTSARLYVSELISVQDNTQLGGVRHVYDYIQHGGLSYVAGRLAERRERREDQASLDNADAPAPYLLEIML